MKDTEINENTGPLKPHTEMAAMYTSFIVFGTKACRRASATKVYGSRSSNAPP